MRTSLLFLLLTTASMPALARPNDEDRAARRDAARAERVERAEARSEAREQRQSERPQQSQSLEHAVEPRSIEPRPVPDRPMILERHPMVVEHRNLERRPDRADVVIARPTLEQRREAIDSVREWRKGEREQLRAGGPKMIVPRDGGTLRERREERLNARDAFNVRRPPVVSTVPRQNTQPPRPSAARPAALRTSHWRGDWRSDHRYDWRNHRRHHRSLFHFGFYYDPFGWDYRPYSIGWRMWPSYYRSSYWLNDPWMYRLPYAPAGYRWIRYFDDAVLVDTWDGRVVDVIYDFFW